MTEQRTRLTQAAAAFRRWAAGFPAEERPASWEVCYEWHDGWGWSEIYTAVAGFLDASNPHDWDATAIEDVLYLLARDNECEWIKAELVERPASLLALAQAGAQMAEKDARWQLADALGTPGVAERDAIPLLVQFCDDPDEYVSRRALLTLAYRRWPGIEPSAVRAWDTGHEYQRMAALTALSAVGSPLLQSYLGQASRGGQTWLAKHAIKVRAGQQN